MSTPSVTPRTSFMGLAKGVPPGKRCPCGWQSPRLAVILLVVCALIVVVSGSIADEVGNAIGAVDTAVIVWGIVKWPVLLALVSVLLAVLFWASPNAKQGIRWVSPGGVVATVAWMAVSALFALYVTNLSSYNKTYGALAGIVIFLIWLWLTNLALLLGAEVNAEIDHAKAVAAGLPEDVRPFAEPRDVRKLNEHDRAAVDNAKIARST